MVPPEIVSKRFFSYRHERWQIRRIRQTNLQLFVSSRRIDFFDRRARKIEDEIQQRVHEQKAALFQRVNCRQLGGMNLANHALRSAIGETSRKLVE